MSDTVSTTEKMAPVQGLSAGIPWAMHLRAYDAYCKRWGSQQALIEGWCRGGFSTSELDDFIPGWRVELDERTQLKRELAAERTKREAAEQERDALKTQGERLTAALEEIAITFE